MRKILIVGSGQSGLQLALTLQAHGYDVTMMSARTPDEIRAARVMSTQCMFHDALTIERSHELNLWDDVAPAITHQGLSLAGENGERALNWAGEWPGPAQSVDQRVKMAAWLELFEQRGGRVIIHGVTTADLNGLARMYELTIVAAGKGELVQLFDRDAERSTYTRPQRALSVSYVHGARQRPERPPGSVDVWVNIIPGIGENINIPGYTLSGACDIVYLSGIPGGPFDAFGDRPGPQQQWQRHLELLREHVPWEYERFREAELTDARGTLVGGYTPVVRHPVGELPSGYPVLGMADVVVANDPVTGQGSNNAARCAQYYLEGILARGEAPFDRDWMRATFEAYWEHAQWVTKFTNRMLEPPLEHVQAILGTAQTNQTVADRFANGMNNPADLADWFFEADKAQAYLEKVAG
ncbi:styrene monooxygenase/indole monooxygenase family protein [Prauserella muralis]|uniref:Oxygenase n=1 Tax=Prauserella muralis TaxID=588067 RepID=A0A2V4ANM4_9PSEU|nr:styrene monooxygenase/indole monooxygenase family protein [Prauserella muralis]PXY22303.1 oxygenase [Prauserella muralis]TWE27952.1 2-polyprenyl-6-methoxyphenol hydroxylase-like FAD-dependent oxidoreductase [Prauserella muralis]